MTTGSLTIQNIILAGFMGTGKSTVGQLLAERLGWTFIDTDEVIEQRAGKPITRIFAEDGEPAFRTIESAVARDVAGLERHVIATGGGMILLEANLRALEQAGAVVLLEAAPETIYARVAHETHRPLLAKPDPQAEVERLLAARREAYGKVNIKILTDGKRPAEVVEELLEKIDFRGTRLKPESRSRAEARSAAQKASKTHLLKAGGKEEPAVSRLSQMDVERMNVIRVELGERSYPIHIGHGWIGSLGEALALCFSPRPCTLVTNPEIRRLWGEPVIASLEHAGYAVNVCEIPEGEANKTLATVEKIYDHMLARKASRQSGIVALGGGVVGDIAGFAAATLLRGITFVQLPTTLLAMVDSSVGGKTGVDHPRGKNLIGAFWQPTFVGIELKFLETLPDEELRSGMAEVIKYGVIADADLFAYLEANIEKALARDPDTLRHLITRSCQIKAEVVGSDERESGLRAILNFGHTFGHAAEALSHYEGLRHGEAVAQGMVAAAWLAVRRGMIGDGELARLEALLGRAGLPTRLPAFSQQKYIDALGSDKKVRDGKLGFVLPERIGRVCVVRDITAAEIGSCLAALALRGA